MEFSFYNSIRIYLRVSLTAQRLTRESAGLSREKQQNTKWTVYAVIAIIMIPLESKELSRVKKSKADRCVSFAVVTLFCIYSYNHCHRV
jgi:hypothetical protein